MKFFDVKTTVLKAARRLLQKPDAFIKGAWARTATGGIPKISVHSGSRNFDKANSPEACQWCYEGAVMKVCGDLGYDSTIARDIISACDVAYVENYKKRTGKMPPYDNLMSINDDQGKKAVLGAMGSAITCLERQFKKEQKAAKAC